MITDEIKFLIERQALDFNSQVLFLYHFAKVSKMVKVRGVMNRKELDKKIKRNKIIEVCETISCICSWICLLGLLPAFIFCTILSRTNVIIALIPLCILLLSLFVVAICLAIIDYLSPTVWF